MSKEAMELALEALESITWVNSFNEGDYLTCNFKSVETSITAIKEALAQPEQEPVAWMTQARNFVHLMEFTEAEAKLYGWSAVYTSPQPAQRTWIGLTDEEIQKEFHPLHATGLQFARAIEAKLKEKNT